MADETPHTGEMLLEAQAGVPVVHWARTPEKPLTHVGVGAAHEAGGVPTVPRMQSSRARTQPTDSLFRQHDMHSDGIAPHVGATSGRMISYDEMRKLRPR